MKKKKNYLDINGIRFSCENNDLEEILNKKMVVYMLSFEDNSCYIGKTERTLLSRLGEHCTNLGRLDKPRVAKINKFKSFNVSIITGASTGPKLLKKESICIKTARELGYDVLN